VNERRVVFVNRFFFPDHSATSQLLSDLAFHLAARGMKIVVVTGAQSYDDPAARLPARETVEGVEIHRVWSTRFGRGRLLGRGFDYLSFYLAAAWTLVAVVRGGDTVVAKTDPPLISVIAAAVARLRGARLVNWIQDLFPEVAIELGVKPVRLLAPLLRRLRNASLRQAGINVAIGQSMVRRLAVAGVDPSSIAVVHNWSSAEDQMVPSMDGSDLRAEWGLAGSFVVGYSGNMGRAHDFATILATATRLRHERNIVFLLIGGGAQRDRIEEEARTRGLSNIVFRPYQPLSRLGESLRTADVHLVSLQPALEGMIVPSKYYGIIAAGRAVIYIGSRDGEIARLIDEAGCGTTVAPGDDTLLCAAIRSMASDPGYCAELGARARRSCESRYSRAHALGHWARLLSPSSDDELEALSHRSHMKAE
jgi:glycosyltransferase involved in cell wall biosynthesis